MVDRQGNHYLSALQRRAEFNICLHIAMGRTDFYPTGIFKTKGTAVRKGELNG